jgi:catechol 2,3-dioxygenase-like lactoylglutathione lyase family enzyme
MATPGNLTLTTITISSPDPPALARFYAQLLGWEIGVEEPGWVTLPNPAGGVKLAIHIEDVYTPPVWPSQPGEQIIMEHVDILVDDLDAACAHAKACGARMADYQPQETVRVHFDPDGHIFCLYLGE